MTKSMSVAKSDMALLTQEQLTQATFGALCQSFAMQILNRSGYEDGLYQRVALEFLDETQEPPAQPVKNIFNIDLSLVLESIRKETLEQKREKKETERLLEQVIRIRHELEKQHTVRQTVAQQLPMPPSRQTAVTRQSISIHNSFHQHAEAVRQAAAEAEATVLKQTRLLRQAAEQRDQARGFKPAAPISRGVRPSEKQTPALASDVADLPAAEAAAHTMGKTVEAKLEQLLKIRQTAEPSAPPVQLLRPEELTHRTEEPKETDKQPVRQKPEPQADRQNITKPIPEAKPASEEKPVFHQNRIEKAQNPAAETGTSKQSLPTEAQKTASRQLASASDESPTHHSSDRAGSETASRQTASSFHAERSMPLIRETLGHGTRKQIASAMPLIHETLRRTNETPSAAKASGTPDLPAAQVTPPEPLTHRTEPQDLEPAAVRKTETALRKSTVPETGRNPVSDGRAAAEIPAMSGRISPNTPELRTGMPATETLTHRREGQASTEKPGAPGSISPKSTDPRIGMAAAETLTHRTEGQTSAEKGSISTKPTNLRVGMAAAETLTHRREGQASAEKPGAPGSISPKSPDLRIGMSVTETLTHRTERQTSTERPGAPGSISPKTTDLRIGVAAAETLTHRTDVQPSTEKGSISTKPTNLRAGMAATEALTHRTDSQPAAGHTDMTRGTSRQEPSSAPRILIHKPEGQPADQTRGVTDVRIAQQSAGKADIRTGVSVTRNTETPSASQAVSGSHGERSLIHRESVSADFTQNGAGMPLMPETLTYRTGETAEAPNAVPVQPATHSELERKTVSGAYTDNPAARPTNPQRSDTVTHTAGTVTALQAQRGTPMSVLQTETNETQPARPIPPETLTYRTEQETVAGQSAAEGGTLRLQSSGSPENPLSDIPSLTKPTSVTARNIRLTETAATPSEPQPAVYADLRGREELAYLPEQTDEAPSAKPAQTTVPPETDPAALRQIRLAETKLRTAERTGMLSEVNRILGEAAQRDIRVSAEPEQPVTPMAGETGAPQTAAKQISPDYARLMALYGNGDSSSAELIHRETEPAPDTHRASELPEARQRDTAGMLQGSRLTQADLAFLSEAQREAVLRKSASGSAAQRDIRVTADAPKSAADRALSPEYVQLMQLYGSDLTEADLQFLSQEQKNQLMQTPPAPQDKLSPVQHSTVEAAYSQTELVLAQSARSESASQTVTHQTQTEQPRTILSRSAADIRTLGRLGVSQNHGISQQLPAKAADQVTGSPVELTYVPGAARLEPQPGVPAAAQESASGSYLDSLPAWAQNAVKHGVPAGSALGGTARKIASLSAPQTETVDWTAPNYAGLMQQASRKPAEVTFKEPPAKEQPQSRSQQLTDSELRRTADKIYQMIEDRIRRERRLLGL